MSRRTRDARGGVGLQVPTPEQLAMLGAAQKAATPKQVNFRVQGGPLMQPVAVTVPGHNERGEPVVLATVYGGQPRFEAGVFQVLAGMLANPDNDVTFRDMVADAILITKETFEQLEENMGAPTSSEGSGDEPQSEGGEEGDTADLDSSQ